MIKHALATAFVLFLIRFIASEAVLQRAKHIGPSTHFPVGIGLRILFRAGGPFLIFVGYKMTEQASGAFDRTTSALVALICIGCLFLEPGVKRAGEPAGDTI
jgi:hypothetical protein